MKSALPLTSKITSKKRHSFGKIINCPLIHAWALRLSLSGRGCLPSQVFPCIRDVKIQQPDGNENVA